jgi:hypothetical protein
VIKYGVDPTIMQPTSGGASEAISEDINVSVVGIFGPWSEVLTGCEFEIEYVARYNGCPD